MEDFGFSELAAVVVARGILGKIRSVLISRGALLIVNLAIIYMNLVIMCGIVLILLAALKKALSVLRNATKYLQALLCQAIVRLSEGPSEGHSSSSSEPAKMVHTQTSNTEACKGSHRSTREASEGPSFLKNSELPCKAPSSLIKMLPSESPYSSCKKASDDPSSSMTIIEPASEDPSSSITIIEPACKAPFSHSHTKPCHEAFEGPSSLQMEYNEAPKGFPSSSNDSFKTYKGHSSNDSCESFKGPSSSHSNTNVALKGPSYSRNTGGTSSESPSSNRNKPSEGSSFLEKSEPSKRPSSLIKLLPCNGDSESPCSLHNSEHASCYKASKAPTSSPTILEPCNGPSSHGNTKPCQGAFEGPSLNMGKEASKECPSPSNKSCEPSKGHSSNSSCEPYKGHSSHSNSEPCLELFEGPRPLSMDNETSKGCPSSSTSTTWADLLKDTTAREVYKRAVNDPAKGKSNINTHKKTDAYSDLLKTGSALFSNMLWKVHFSNDFKNSFPQINSVEKKAKIVNRIRRLSSGHHFSKYKTGCVPPTDKLHGLIEVDVVADLCLVWNIDIERDVEAVQIIKIWDIVDREILPKLVKRLRAALNVYSEHYIERCKIRHLSRDKELAVPERWVEDPDFVWLKPHETSSQVTRSQEQSSQSDNANVDNSSVSESLLLMKFYAMSSGIAKNLLTAADGSEVNLPFQVNKEESLTIRHQSSCFILGRSGTGKTTVLMTKLIQREHQNEISISGLNLSEAPAEATKECSIAKKEHIKQIFVTLSPLLCSDIKQQITQIQRTQSAAAGLTSAQNHTSSEYELLLDGDIESKITGIFPNTFIDVPSKYYPMVLTFRKFLMMLANSVPCPFLKYKTERKEVDYDRFDSVYWPHLNANLTKKFDSSTVFTEIMSIIKGSVQAVKSDKGVLSKESYCLLNSTTKQLSVPQKEDIYSLFMQYEKLKMETNCYDMADWVKHTYKQLCCGEYHGDKIDFVYIDEVQDFTQAQLFLFSFVCTNMKEGYTFAGDTAQTITRGVHFRFQDGRSLFYTDFMESVHTCGGDIGAAANTRNSKLEFKPKLFQLRHNFRTHMGVVKMSNSIVQLLYHFFPQSIDKLDPETSFVWGQMPALLKGQQEELVKRMHNMGAQQVIIVRDEAQKALLLKQIGKSGLVLTISGCKGLEFQDVLLYNFFSGSAMQNKWKVLYEYPFQTNVMKPNGISEKKTHPTFDVNKHHLLCSELKHLYVAVTRARERLWIFEENNDFCKPMLDYWLDHELIETKSLDQSFVFSVKSSSTPDNWRTTGLKLFNRQHYDDAMLCFERAGHEQYVQHAKAASLKQKGEKQLSTNRKEAIYKLREAAEIFLVLEKTEKAAECYITIGDLKKAGVLYIENCSPPKFEDAGDCFREAKSWLEAGEAYFGGGCINKCLDACFKGKHFEKGLSFIKQWRKGPLTDEFQDEKVGYEQVINEYLQKCAANFHQQHIMTMMVFVNAFSSTDLKRAFLRGRNCFHELMCMEEAEGNYLQAAEMAEVKGDLLHAAMLLEKAGDYDNAVKKILLLILKDALWGEQNRGWPFRTMKRPEELLQRVKTVATLAENSVRHEAQLEVQLIFEGLRNPQDVKYLIAHAQTSSSIKIKFFTTWKALDSFLRILKEQKLANEDRNAMLVQTLSLWIDWQAIILHFKKVVLGQDHLQKAIPESVQDDKIREFCYEIFGVTQGEDCRVCFVHNIQAWWFEGHKKGVPPIKISMKEFAKLFAKFWNEKLLEKEKEITEMCNLQTQLLILLWPQVRTAEEMPHIQKLRESTTIVAMLDKIADQIISNPETMWTLEATGRLQLIFPFLSEAWKERNASSCKTKVAFWKNAITFDWRNPRVLSVENYIVECGKPLINVFYTDWKNIQKYISPLVFVTLLERVIVMACACDTLLHGMVLPITLAVEVMCGKAQEVLYHDILSYNDLAGESLDSLIASIIKIAFQLLKKPTDIEEWIKHAQGDPNTDLHPLVLRLTTLLFTIFLNSRNVKLKEAVIGKLQKMFDYQAPGLQQLPRSYVKKCRKACFLISRTGAANDKRMKGVKHAFAKALMSVGDSLLMTVRCKKAPCCKPQDGISTIELDCETDISMQLQALSSSAYISSETCKAQHISQMTVRGRETEEAVKHPSTEKEEYNTYFNQTAFPLKVSVEKDLHRLSSVISSLASMMTNLSQHKERCQQEIQYLDPRFKI